MTKTEQAVIESAVLVVDTAVEFATSGKLTADKVALVYAAQDVLRAATGKLEAERWGTHNP